MAASVSAVSQQNRSLLYIEADEYINRFTRDFEPYLAEKVCRLAQGWIQASQHKFSNNLAAYARLSGALKAEERADQSKLVGFTALFTAYACEKLDCLGASRDSATFRACRDKAQLESFFFANEIQFAADGDDYTLASGALEKLAELIMREEKELSFVNQYLSELYATTGLEPPLFKSLGLREYAFGLSKAYCGKCYGHQGWALLSAAEGFKFELPQAPADNNRKFGKEFNNWDCNNYSEVTRTPFAFKGSIVNLRLAIDKIKEIEKSAALLQDELLTLILQGIEGMEMQDFGIGVVKGPCKKDMRVV